VKGAEGRRRDQKLAFGALDWLQFHIAIQLGPFIELGSEKMDLPRFRLESDGRTDASRPFVEDARLPIRAQLMIARINGEEEIRFALVCPNPRASSGVATGCCFSLVFTSNCVSLEPHPPLAAAAAGWSCARTGDAKRRTARMAFIMPVGRALEQGCFR
jgi:hypothetical protein